MCLIIAPGADKPALLPEDVFKYVYDRNSDGFGAMWVEDDQVKHFKTIGMTDQQIYDTMVEYSERHEGVVFHMRLKTHGQVTPGLCHPFRILHRSRHGVDMFFMHNGVMGEWGRSLTRGQSDTTNFKDKVLIPILTRDPDALDDPEVMAMINRLTSGSRLIFMNSKGKVWRTAEHSWNNRFGLTLSNTYMVPDEKKTVVLGTPSNPNLEEENLGRNPIYTAYRRISTDGVEKGLWCTTPKSGFVRTEYGKLYIDNGANQVIYHNTGFIPKDREVQALNSLYAPAVDDFKDDELTWKKDEFWDEENTDKEEEKYTVGDAAVSMDEKLRYARLVHNCHSGKVSHREQLVADVLSTGNKELFEFVKEDPETASVVLSEIFEIMIEMNDVLLNGEETKVYSFDPDVICSRGAISYHKQAMTDITAARRAEYKKMLEERRDAREVARAEIADRMETAHEKAWKDDPNNPDVAKVA